MIDMCDNYIKNLGNKIFWFRPSLITIIRPYMIYLFLVLLLHSRR